MNIEQLRSLQERIRSSTAADRELDGEIAKALLGWTFTKMKGDAQPYWRKPGVTEYYMREKGPLPFTSNPDGLGACVALLNTALPSGHWARTPDGTFRAFNAGMAYEAKPLATDCHTFIDCIISAKIAELEAMEAV